MNLQRSELKRSLRAILSVLFMLGGCKDNGIQPPPIETAITRDDAPAWSPDGSRICYEHVNIDPNDTTYPTGLYLIDSSGINRQLVISGSVHNPDWSPDGRRIAFTRGDIFTISPSGDSLQKITSSGNVFFPSWSSDGKYLAFARSGPQDSVGIWILDLPMMTESRLGFGGEPDWSPTGLQIVYSGPPGSTGSESQIWVVDTNGSNNTELTANMSHINRYPAWSPDGALIAWTTDVGISLMKSDGSNPRVVALDYASEPSWSNDSRQIVYTKLNHTRDRSVLWKINIDGSGERQLTN